jgi:hypothetical protein
MITKSKQRWIVGETVKVGWMFFTVKEVIPTPGDYKPDMYVLESKTGKRYSFTPYNGLERMDDPPSTIELTWKSSN